MKGKPLFRVQGLGFDVVIIAHYIATVYRDNGEENGNYYNWLCRAV